MRRTAQRKDGNLQTEREAYLNPRPYILDLTDPTPYTLHPTS
jgi:hypothetical protein